VRPMGPSRSARIARFRITSFSSNKTLSKLLIHLLRRSLPAALLFSAVIPRIARAQTVFHFSEEVHWGNAVLPPGDYVITSLDAKSNGTASRSAASGRDSALSTARDTGQEGAGGSAIPAHGRLFAIRNPRNQAMPYAQAETIYLSACRVVEQEFRRAEPLRPRLTLVLGASRDGVYFRNREIQLKKWNDYQFAQGVVLLAVDDMLPKDKKILLTRLSVLEAESTVDVRELEGGRAPVSGKPQN